MEGQFEKRVISCLDLSLREIQNAEQTQQLQLPDGMPDIGRVLCAWGQPILRSKEWDGDRISASVGMLVWVLYSPEDGSREQCIDTWIPFQMRWELPDQTPEGEIRIQCLPRFVDARSVSPRKLQVRCGVAVQAEALSGKELAIQGPEEGQKEIQFLHSTYPVRLGKEAGERSILLDEELPDVAADAEQILYYQLNPRVTDKKVLGNKVVFRGNGNLHLLCRKKDGKLESMDAELPFSQYAQLEWEHGPDAQADLTLLPTSLETELAENGQLRVKAALAAQYLISDKELLRIVEDGYSPVREVALQTEELELPAILENRRENLYGEQSLPGEAQKTVDVRLLTDFPRQRREGSEVILEMPGTFQVLYYGEDGVLRSASARWEGQQRLPAHENSRITAIPMAAEPQALTGNGQILAKAEVPLEIQAETRQVIPMVTGAEPGPVKELDPARPSLILRRSGAQGLWDMAKETGSTVEAIKQANGLQEEPAPGQMLLIPVS